WIIVIGQVFSEESWCLPDPRIVSEGIGDQPDQLCAQIPWICLLNQQFHPQNGTTRLKHHSICFSVSGFMWRTLIHLDFNFVQGG
ncbi:mannosyl (alpha-1,3-)-glycoprotein beta-1,4-N-acetylglucosaminyltransferase, isozyme C (putative), isoform CRA_a, partial [Mus musculus]